MANLNTFSISNQNQFDEALMWVSDLYKDTYGFRPRGYNFSGWSFTELTDFINDLSDEQDRVEANSRVSRGGLRYFPYPLLFLPLLCLCTNYIRY